jgi:hypothetical protein
MNIVARKREFFHIVAIHVPAKVSRLFIFGFDTLVGCEVKSTRANARRSAHGWNTAKSKMHRLLGNVRIASVFPTLLLRLSLVSNDDVVAVDFSDFGGGRQVLMFARQTRKGRAMPLYFEILEYPIEKDSQNLFIIGAITRFFAAVHCTPTLVFDRGFACPSVIKFLAQHKYKFIIRIKKRKTLADAKTGAVSAAERFADNDVHVHAYGHDLRLVVSDKPKEDNDPWYLITNDAASERDDIVAMYYHRFEIEEFFRDCKRILGFEQLRFKTTQGLTLALWFALLTCWFFERIAEKLTDLQEAERKLWRVSRFRYVCESFLRETLRACEKVPNLAPLPV